MFDRVLTKPQGDILALAHIFQFVKRNILTKGNLIFYSGVCFCNYSVEWIGRYIEATIDMQSTDQLFRKFWKLLKKHAAVDSSKVQLY